MNIAVLSFVALSCSGCIIGSGGDFYLDSASSSSNEIIVANETGKSVTVLSPTGEYLRDLVLLRKPNGGFVRHISFFDETSVLVSTDTPDQVLRVRLDGTQDPFNTEVLIADAQLTGNLFGVARLLSGDILIVESNNVERYSTGGTRVTAGGWPKALQTTGSAIRPLSSGGFIHCSTGTDVLRIYDPDGNVLSSASSGIPGTTDVYSCDVSSDGRVVAVFNGTTDTVRVYTNTTLSTVSFSYSDTSLLGNPRAAAFRPNGNVLTSDYTNNVLVELDTFGNVVALYHSAVINGSVSLLVTP